MNTSFSTHRIIFSVAALVCAFLLGHYYGDNSELVSAQERQLTNLNTAKRFWQHEYDVASKQYRVDTVRLRAAQTRYESTRDSALIAVSDSAINTLPAVPIVRRALAQADSTITTCRMALSSCERKALASDSVASTLSQQRDIYKALAPTKTSKIITAAKWVVVGIAADRLYKASR